MPQETKGFTLSEVVFVVAIVLVLAGFVFAASPGVRESARERGCMENMHEIAMAMHLYGGDYQGDDVDGLPGIPRQVFRNPTVMVAAGYLRANSAVWKCPNTPHCSEYRFFSTYQFAVWADRPKDLGHNGERSYDEQQRRIAILGSSYPIIKCFMHEETYYHTLDEITPLLQPAIFVTWIDADTSAHKGWRQELYVHQARIECKKDRLKDWRW